MTNDQFFDAICKPCQMGQARHNPARCATTIRPAVKGVRVNVNL